MRSILIQPAATVLLIAMASSVTPARADKREEARHEFRVGMALIGIGEYERGIKSLEMAYALHPHPSVLHNIAAAYMELKDYEKAVDYFERTAYYFEQYLKANPPDREAAQQSLVNECKHLEEARRALRESGKRRSLKRATARKLAKFMPKCDIGKRARQPAGTTGSATKPKPEPGGQGTE